MQFDREAALRCHLAFPQTRDRRYTFKLRHYRSSACGPRIEMRVEARRSGGVARASPPCRSDILPERRLGRPRYAFLHFSLDMPVMVAYISCRRRAPAGLAMERVIGSGKKMTGKIGKRCNFDETNSVIYCKYRV